MSVGVWMVPVVLATTVVFLWAAAWFEGIVAPPGYRPERPTLEAVDTGRSNTGARPEFLGGDSQLDVEPDRPAA